MERVGAQERDAVRGVRNVELRLQARFRVSTGWSPWPARTQSFEVSLEKEAVVRRWRCAVEPAGNGSRHIPTHPSRRRGGRQRVARKRSGVEGDLRRLRARAPWACNAMDVEEVARAAARASAWRQTLASEVQL